MTQFLIFRVGECELALEILHVREVVRAAALSVPANPTPAIEGVLNLRGQVVPVVSLGTVVGIVQPPMIETDFLIVLNGSDNRLFAVRSTSEVQSTSDVEKVEATDGMNSSRHVAGLIRIGRRIVSVLDPNAISPHATARVGSQTPGGRPT